MKETKNICGYCKKEITKKQIYARLTSRIRLHESNNEKESCYQKAFITERKTLKGIMFNLKNDILCNYNKVSFFLKYVRINKP